MTDSINTTPDRRNTVAGAWPRAWPPRSLDSISATLRSDSIGLMREARHTKSIQAAGRQHAEHGNRCDRHADIVAGYFEVLRRGEPPGLER